MSRRVHPVGQVVDGGAGPTMGLPSQGRATDDGSYTDRTPEVARTADANACSTTRAYERPASRGPPCDRNDTDLAGLGLARRFKRTSKPRRCKMSVRLSLPAEASSVLE